MIELVRGLTPIQWLLIGGGVLLLIPTAINLLKKMADSVAPSVPAIGLTSNLTSIVHKWEALDDACEQAGLVEAQEKLREVFLAFAKKPSPKPKTDKEISTL
jgi:hypothetical protein